MEVIDRLLERQIDVELRELKNRFIGASAYYKGRYHGMDRVLSVLKSWLIPRK